MKTTLKIAVCVLFLGIAGMVVAQDATTTSNKQTTQSSKNKSKKAVKQSDNKIAVSDQAQPNDKKKHTTAKKDSGITTK